MDRALSFGAVADDYDRLRPSPPMDAVRWLVPPDASAVVDLGAGTGRMTRQLLEVAPDVTAIEPDERMLAVLAERSPGVHALTGRGDSMPIPDSSADALVVSSAWHWMDVEPTVAEIARVLRDGGRFGVIWTNRDFDVPWLREIAMSAMPSERSEESRRAGRRLELPEGAPFTAVEAARFRFTMVMTVADIAASFGTYSAVIARGPDFAASIVAKVLGLLQDRFGDVESIELPMRSLAFRTSRRRR